MAYSSRRKGIAVPAALAVPGAVTCVRIVAGTLTQRPHTAPLGSKRVVGHINHRLPGMRLVRQGVLPKTGGLPHRCAHGGAESSMAPSPSQAASPPPCDLLRENPFTMRCVIPASLPAGARPRRALREAWSQSRLITGIWGSVRTADSPPQLRPAFSNPSAPTLPQAAASVQTAYGEVKMSPRCCGALLWASLKLSLPNMME